MRKKQWMAILIAFSMMSVILPGLAEQPARAEDVTVPVFDQIKKFEIPENDAMRLLSDMKSGWNLGNTFDAYDGFAGQSEGTDLETYWAHAKVTPELIAAVQEAGFNTIRIPVSWHNHVDENDRIDPVWMARVKEVAGWALAKGIYVIVNVHHDDNAHYLYPDSAHFSRSSAYLSSVWQQMAEAFRDCDEHLILESMNEPRLVGTRYEWNWVESDKTCKDAADCINRLNQLFVDIIRQSGGNNATRYLSVPSYCASPWSACNQAFQLPDDPAGNRIIVAVHAYTPYDFALNKESADKRFDPEKDQRKKSDIAGFMNLLYERFIKQGVPVMIGEFGALDKGGNTGDRVNYTAYYTASASARGITCIWWDNHCFTGEGERFGLIDRNTTEWRYPEIVSAIQANCRYNR